MIIGATMKFKASTMKNFTSSWLLDSLSNFSSGRNQEVSPRWSFVAQQTHLNTQWSLSEMAHKDKKYVWCWAGGEMTVWLCVEGLDGGLWYESVVAQGWQGQAGVTGSSWARLGWAETRDWRPGLSSSSWPPSHHHLTWDPPWHTAHTYLPPHTPAASRSFSPRYSFSLCIKQMSSRIKRHCKKENYK